jgi:ABC-type Zn uptake system ZnuABC Zn-binding protein ZnuA
MQCAFRGLAGLGLASLLLLGQGCSSPPDDWSGAKGNQKKVLASFAPLYSLAHAIAGDDAHVLCVLTTTGPHDYQASPTDAVKFKRADLALCIGLGFDERFMNRLKDSAYNKNLEVFEIGEVLDHHQLLHMEHGAGHEGHNHKHGEHDPHIWLGPRQAIALVKHIAAKLGQIDPAHKKSYDERAVKLAAELNQLHQDGMKAFEGKKNKRLVTMHESLNYFAKAFELEIVGSIQFRPGEEVSAPRLAELVKLCQEKNVGVIAIEPQYSKSAAETLQKELQRKGLSVQLVEIDPLETAPRVDGSLNPDPAFYLRNLRQNVERLAKAMP